MIHLLLYGHGSKHGGGGYRFVGTSYDLPREVRQEIEVLLNKLAYTEQMLQGSTGYLRLNLDNQLRLLGKVSVEGRDREATLEYRLIVVSNEQAESDPLDLAQLFDQEKLWKADTQGFLVEPELGSSKPSGSRPTSNGRWKGYKLPWPLIRKSSRDILQAWLDGLGEEDRRAATYLIPEPSDRSGFAPFVGQCHFSSPLVVSREIPSRSRSPGCQVGALKMMLITACAVAIGLGGGFLISQNLSLARNDSEPGKGDDTRTPEDPVRSPLTAGQAADLDRMADILKDFATELQKFDALPHVMAVGGFSESHPRSDLFSNVESYLERASTAEQDRDRLSHLIFAVDEVRQLLSLERDIATQTTILHDKVEAIGSVLNDLNSPISPVVKDPQAQRRRQVNDLINRLNEALFFLEHEPEPAAGSDLQP